MLALVALLAASLDISWVRPGSDERVWRGPQKRDSISLAPDNGAAALREKDGFLILPGQVRLPRASAAAFSPDSRELVAAYESGEIVATDLSGEWPWVLGQMRGVERLAWGKGVVAAGRGGATLLPSSRLTAAPVRELAVAGDRIALAIPSALLLFDGSGKLLSRVRASVSSLAFSKAGMLAYAVGREVWLIDSALKPRRLAAEKSAIRMIVFAGEVPVWLADGARRADGKRLDCARSLAATDEGLLAACGDRVVTWDGDAQSTVQTESECYVSIEQAFPLGDGFLIGRVVHDRRFIVCGNPLSPR